MRREDILILGAGPSGMAAAFQLHQGGVPCTVVEARDSVGGLSRTLHFKEFSTDIGPHRFYSENQLLYDIITDLLGDRWVPGERLSRFYIGGKLYDFPKIRKGLLVAGPYKTARIGVDYLWERLKGIAGKKSDNFEQLVVSSFGRTLAELNVLNFTEKFWGLPCDQISPDWADERLFDISVGRMLKKMVPGLSVVTRNLANGFHYPDSGIGLIWDEMKVRAQKSATFMMGSRPVKIVHDGKNITNVVVEKGDGMVAFRPLNVISSIPVTEFLKILEPGPPEDVLDAADHLKFRSHISLLITLDKENVFPDNWLYFPERDIPFARVMEPKNFSRHMAPDGKTSLLVELFCQYGDHTWNAGEDELFEQSLMWLEKMGFVKKSEVIDRVIIDKERYAYPVYDLGYSRWRGAVMDYLAGFDNLQAIGRGGDFLYNNMDTAMEMGIQAAQDIAKRSSIGEKEGAVNEQYIRE